MGLPFEDLTGELREGSSHEKAGTIEQSILMGCKQTSNVVLRLCMPVKQSNIGETSILWIHYIVAHPQSQVEDPES